MSNINYYCCGDKGRVFYICLTPYPPNMIEVEICEYFGRYVKRLGCSYPVFYNSISSMDYQNYLKWIAYIMTKEDLNCYA